MNINNITSETCSIIAPLDKLAWIFVPPSPPLHNNNLMFVIVFLQDYSCTLKT